MTGKSLLSISLSINPVIYRIIQKNIFMLNSIETFLLLLIYLFQ